MNTKRCLYCYLPVETGTGTEFHEKCAKKIFGSSSPPMPEPDQENLTKLGEQLVARHITVPGVQPKLSVQVKKSEAGSPSRLTVVGLWGDYILKLSTKELPFMAENEDLTMHLAQELGIKTATHTLIRISSGELAYLCKRFDRVKSEKLQCEDFCQLSEQLTEHKYRGSLEKAGKVLKKHVAHPLLDAISFFELALFSFLTGNADMHLKNFSILRDPKGAYHFSPAYDLVCTQLLMPEDNEETALTLNGKKNKLTRNDFDLLGISLGLTTKQMEYSYTRFYKKQAALEAFITRSFLPEALQTQYAELLNARYQRLKSAV